MARERHLLNIVSTRANLRQGPVSEKFSVGKLPLGPILFTNKFY